MMRRSETARGLAGQGPTTYFAAMMEQIDAAVIGSGPAGLAAAEVLAARGHRAVVFDHMPSVGRKFLMAGKSGLNLTRVEPPDAFLAAFGAAAPRLAPMLAAFGPAAVMAWAADLGEPLFTGTTGRVFPVAMKASPLLRRWLGRVAPDLRLRWRWRGWDGDALVFDTPDGPARVLARTTVLACGGASWARLGSDGAWADWIGAPVAPWRPANMGIRVAWSPGFVARHAGQPLKGARLSLDRHTTRGETLVTPQGLEGGGIYALSAAIRTALDRGPVTLELDLAPDRDAPALARRLARPRGRASLANHWRKSVGIEGLRAGLLRELAPGDLADPADTARAIKGLALPVTGVAPLDRAISSAGGLVWDALDARLMVRGRAGVFAAGEMLDWEAPTGGYLLTACLATGRWAGAGAADWLARPR